MDQQGERQPVRQVTVEQGEAGMRLDRFLAGQWPGLPLAAIQRLLRTGQVRVNSGRAKGNERLSLGDRVRLPPVWLPPAGEPIRPPERALEQLRARILLRDDDLLVLDKPAGMPVHGGSGHAWGVVDGVKALFAGEGVQPELCHRLDLDTSGCLLLGLHPPAVRALTASFREHGVVKEYLALVLGVPDPPKGEIDLALAKGQTRAGERVMVTGEGGRHARTRYQVEALLPDCALMRVRLLTGRTHQIRVHFQELGHPVAGDEKYGDWEFNRRLRELGLKRLFLHAETLSFPHPMSGQPVRVRAPLATELGEVLTSLGQG